MAEKRRLISCFIAALFVFVILSSLFFIVLEADHDCTGEHCPVCHQINICERALKSGFAVAVLVAPVLLGVIFPSAAPVASAVCLCLTPVTLKVKLSD
ncbi:MAG: hypothetical protein K5841_08840 [Fretibacterium sp.]|nr:hypothetical protein [Fretibacterium sp.]